MSPTKRRSRLSYNAPTTTTSPATATTIPNLTILDLPYDVFNNITHFLTPRDRTNLSLTCKHLRRQISYNYHKHVSLLGQRECLNTVIKVLDTDASALAQSVTSLTFDCRGILSLAEMQLRYLGRKPRWESGRGSRYGFGSRWRECLPSMVSGWSRLSSRLLDIEGRDDDLVLLIEKLAGVLRRLVNLRRVTVTEPVFGACTLPAPPCLVQRVRAMNAGVPRLAVPHVMTWTPLRTHYSMRCVLVAMKRSGKLDGARACEVCVWNSATSVNVVDVDALLPGLDALARVEDNRVLVRRLKTS